MAKYVTQKELESTIHEINKAMFYIDVAIEVLAEIYCKVDKEKFAEYVTKCIENRLKNAKDENDLNNKE